MAVSLTVLKEAGDETRVAATPETVKKMSGLGIKVTVEAGAGAAAGFDDTSYKQAGASVTKAINAVLEKSDVVFGVRAPAAAHINAMKANAVLVASLNPYQNASGVKSYAKAKIQAMSMELMPRITRAQSMDILSSQSNLAGYKAVLDATAEYGRALPMMMTAATQARHSSTRTTRSFTTTSPLAATPSRATASRGRTRTRRPTATCSSLPTAPARACSGGSGRTWPSTRRAISPHSPRQRSHRRLRPRRRLPDSPTTTRSRRCSL